MGSMCVAHAHRTDYDADLHRESVLMTSQDTEKTIVAVPVADGRLCSHFGHCQQFALFEVDLQKRQIQGSRHLAPPPHEPGLLPRWLHELQTNVVIAGGMGQRARDLFREQGIEVMVGAPAEEPQSVVQAYLDGNLTVAENPCDH